MGEYKCGLCGKVYDNYTDYAECVSKCAAKKNKEELLLREEKLKQEKSARLKEVMAAHETYMDAYKKYESLADKYRQDYPEEDTIGINRLFDIILNKW